MCTYVHSMYSHSHVEENEYKKVLRKFLNLDIYFTLQFIKMYEFLIEFKSNLLQCHLGKMYAENYSANI